jgi:hypothetical protein
MQSPVPLKKKKRKKERKEGRKEGQAQVTGDKNLPD